VQGETYRIYSGGVGAKHDSGMTCLKVRCYSSGYVLEGKGGGRKRGCCEKELKREKINKKTKLLGQELGCVAAWVTKEGSFEDDRREDRSVEGIGAINKIG